MFDLNDEDQEQLAIGGGGVFLVASGAAGAWFAPMLEPVRAWALESHLLTDSALIVAMPGGVGLDLPRVIFAAGIIGVLLAGGTWWAVHHFRTSRERKRS